MSTLDAELRDALARRYFDGMIDTLAQEQTMPEDGLLPSEYPDGFEMHPGQRAVLMMAAYERVDYGAEGIAMQYRENPVAVMQAMYLAGHLIAESIIFVDENGMDDAAPYNAADSMP